MDPQILRDKLVKEFNCTNLLRSVKYQDITINEFFLSDEELFISYCAKMTFNPGLKHHQKIQFQSLLQQFLSLP